jgi:hypothetical protein
LKLAAFVVGKGLNNSRRFLDCIAKIATRGLQKIKFLGEFPEMPRHRSRLAEGAQSNITNRNIKWLTPFFFPFFSSDVLRSKL